MITPPLYVSLTVVIKKKTHKYMDIFNPETRGQ